MRNLLSVTISSVVLSLAACGGGKSNPAAGGGGGSGGAQLGEAQVKAAALGAYEGRQAAGTLAVVAVDAARAASALGAGGTALRTFGTLTQDQAGQYAYQPTPTDRLVVRLANGRELEFVVTTMQGDVAAGGVEFFRGEHALGLTIRGTDVDLAVEHVERGRQSQGRVRGSVVFAGATFALDLTLAGASFYDRGFGSIHYELDERVTGTVTGTDLAATVDDTTHFVIISDSRSAVSQSSRRFSGVWQIGTATYELRDAAINRAFRGGIPNELNSAWSVRGTLLRDGQPVGTLQFGQRDLAVRVWLELGGGREVELESHQIR